jgi:2,3-dihydroxyphenylpropionate 1,2-dioxygenase
LTLAQSFVNMPMPIVRAVPKEIELTDKFAQAKSLVLGGAMLPHAPQFFTRPATEDGATIARVERIAATIGEQLAKLQPDVWVTVSNDHAQQFFLDCAPPFTLHVGGEARGTFAGQAFRYSIASDVSRALVQSLYRLGFDPAFSSTAEVDYALGIPLTHLGVRAPIVPIFVNAYLPPQPTIERCYAFGQALATALGALGVTAVVIASGGMSHFPGTDRYANPDLSFDRALLEPLARGNLKALIGLAEAQLDASGNIELRCWAVAAGMLGERKPDVLELNPSWHHNYASLGFWSPQADPGEPHYPATRPELVALTAALHALANDAEARRAFARDPHAFALRWQVEGSHVSLLVNFEVEALVALGVHPLVPFLARLQIERSRD